MVEIELDVVIPPPRPQMGRKLPRRESAILLIATSEKRLGDTSIKTGAWYDNLRQSEAFQGSPGAAGNA